jgi:hypothetical protein
LKITFIHLINVFPGEMWFQDGGWQVTLEDKPSSSICHCPSFSPTQSDFFCLEASERGKEENLFLDSNLERLPFS